MIKAPGNVFLHFRGLYLGEDKYFFLSWVIIKGGGSFDSLIIDVISGFIHKK